MKIWCRILLISLLPLLFINAQDKNVKKTFKVNPNQRVFINGISGMDIKIIGQDKNEAEFNINVKAKSSDAGFQAAYIQNFDVTYKYSGNDVIIDVIETPDKGKWSVLDVLKGDFKYSFSKEITGEIFLPKDVSVVGDFLYSNISVSTLNESLILKGKGNHFIVRDCNKVNEIYNEIGDVVVSMSAGKLNSELKLSSMTIEDFSGQVKINATNSTINIARLNGSINYKAYDTKGTVEDVTKGVFLYSDISDLTFKKIGGVLEIIDINSYLKVYDIDGFKLEGDKTDLFAERINSKAKEKVFLTTKNGKLRVQNSAGSFFIDDDYSDYSFNNVNGNINYSASYSFFTGKELKGDWKSDTKYSQISLMEITASYIEAIGKGKKFKAVIANNPKKVEVKNWDADVELTVNKEIKTSLFLKSQGGSIHTEFNIRTYREGSSKKAAEKINGGGAILIVETKEGSIIIKKR